ncbi:hypothetical protein HJG60_010802 [Phyllostomus discolor]|uniref:Uncharacterized protein n=1 Tax=Phyllostomus discolor TaxID=89673 RepID=A0A834AEJ7_9CHIR|nr:hypothetical protein HJG60_010802 [Phyllostomus discolor]
MRRPVLAVTFLPQLSGPWCGLESSVCCLSGSLGTGLHLLSVTGGQSSCISVLAWAWLTLSCGGVPRRGQGAGWGQGSFSEKDQPFSLINLFIWSLCGGGVFPSLRPLGVLPWCAGCWAREGGVSQTPVRKSAVSSAFRESERLKKGLNREASWQVVSILHQGKPRLRDSLRRVAHPEPRSAPPWAAAGCHGWL